MSADAWSEVEALAAGVRSALPAALVGLYLHGSLVTGGFVPGKSDLDLLAVVRRELDDQEAHELEAVFASTSARTTDIDFRAVTESVAATPSASGWAPTLALEVEVRPASDRPVRPRQGPVDEPDLVIELAQVRETSRALVGPAAPDVIGPVPDELVLAVADGHLARWQRVPFNSAVAELMVFTACRAWRFAVTGEHASKVDAATWAIEHCPDLTVVEEALALRRGDEGIISPDSVGQLLGTARDAIARRAS
jgi:predicted nucleotidyltransferase